MSATPPLSGGSLVSPAAAVGPAVAVSTAAHVSVEGLVAGYGRAGAPVLAGVDLELPAAHCLAVVGRSGCGKSTLLNVLAGVLTPVAGRVELRETAVTADGVPRGASAPPVAAPPSSAAGRAAYMFQQDLLLPWKSVLDNATFAARMAARGAACRVAGGRRPREWAELEARARALLVEFGLGDALDALPSELSGGMRQRVALARTLLMGRGLVLLDEPLGSLDAVTRAEMRRWLFEVMTVHSATWVLVTHDVEEAVLLGDHVAVLHGRPARLTAWADAEVARGDRLRISAAEVSGAGGGVPDAGAERLRTAAVRIRRALASAEATTDQESGLCRQS